MRAPIPLKTSYHFLRRFHTAAHRTLVRSRTQKLLLQENGFNNLADTARCCGCRGRFKPRGKEALSLRRPISLYMGRVAIEKGIGDFRWLDLPGTKVVIGGGPDLGRLRKLYPKAISLDQNLDWSWPACCRRPMFFFPAAPIHWACMAGGDGLRLPVAASRFPV